jgi:hypothetical protein
MTETISGILTDYAVMTEGEHAGRYGARINDTPYPVMPHVDAFLTRLQKNVPVEVHLNKDGWISKITPAKKSPVPAAKKAEPTAQDIDQEKAEYNAKAADEARNLERKRKEQETLAEKLAKAGFEQPAKAQAPLVDAEKPLPKPTEPGLKTAIGQIQAVNPDKRGIAVKDVDGVVHPFYWLPALDPVFSRLQKWWYIKITAEGVGDEWRAISQTKADKPEGWKSSGFGGKGNYQPRNDRAIIYQTAYKEACETARTIAKNTGWSNETEAEKAFNKIMDMALTRALKDGAELCKAGGV